MKKITLIFSGALFIALMAMNFNAVCNNSSSVGLSLEQLLNSAFAQDSESDSGTLQTKSFKGPTNTTVTTKNNDGTTTVKYYRVEGTYVENTKTGEITDDKREQTCYMTRTY